MHEAHTDLILDIGNTRSKLGLFKASGSLRTGTMANGDMVALREFIGSDRPVAIALGSVAAPDDGFLARLRELAPVFVFDGASEAPIRNKYATPATLGADRLANVVAGARRFPGRPVLVADLGTCITYDVSEADGTYAGGAITPGMVMRAKAMNAYSARLPLVDPPEAPNNLGTSTREALEAGIHHGILGEMREFVRAYGKERPSMAVVLTGGDALRFARAMESGIFAIPFLTLEGYHALLEHHRSIHHGARPAGAGGAGGAG
ncbi:MAG: type III pantothenate kinase [Flavobacteriales bacterium]